MIHLMGLIRGRASTAGLNNVARLLKSSDHAGGLSKLKVQCSSGMAFLRAASACFLDTPSKKSLSLAVQKPAVLTTPLELGGMPLQPRGAWIKLVGTPRGVEGVRSLSSGGGDGGEVLIYRSESESTMKVRVITSPYSNLLQLVYPLNPLFVSLWLLLPWLKSEFVS